MRILHTADWHLGKKLDNYSRLEEQKKVLHEICTIADTKNADVIIIAGDIFDNYNPSTEAIELFYKTVKKLSNNGKRPVIAIAGNHDSPDRIETADPLAVECGIIFAGYPDTIINPFNLESGIKVTKSEPGFIELDIEGQTHPLRVIFTPYANEHRLKQSLLSENSEDELRFLLQERWKKVAQEHCNTNGVNVLCTHLFVIQKGNDIPKEPDDEKPILHVGGAQAIYTENFPAEMQYIALGHLHRKQNISGNEQPVVYSGSPLAYSFAETNQDKFVVIADILPDQQAQIEYVTLTEGKKLKRIKAIGIQQAIEELSKHEDYLVELAIETETYLSANERKEIYNSHKGIISLIPYVNNVSENENSEQQIDINKSMKELFVDYFQQEHQTMPNENIMNLFNEVIAEKDEA